MNESSKDRISLKQAKVLKEVFATKPNLTTDTALSDFLSAYFLCEALANKLVEYYRKTDSSYKPLDVGNLKKALTHFSVEFPEADTDAIFKSSKGAGGQRTARQLRNKYIHSSSSKSREEIGDCSAELLKLMTSFSTSVENRISGC